jgi:hypothetical protein
MKLIEFRFPVQVTQESTIAELVDAMDNQVDDHVSKRNQPNYQSQKLLVVNELNVP